MFVYNVRCTKKGSENANMPEKGVTTKCMAANLNPDESEATQGYLANTW